MESSLAKKYLIEALSMSNKIKKSVRERVKSGKCLICNCDQPIEGRGLCRVHRNQFYNQLRSIQSKEQQLEFEANCIRDGLILPAGKQIGIKKEDGNPFINAKVS